MISGDWQSSMLRHDDSAWNHSLVFLSGFRRRSGLGTHASQDWLKQELCKRASERI